MKLTDATLDDLRPQPRDLDPEWSASTLTTILSTPGAGRQVGAGAARCPRRGVAISLLAAVSLSTGLGIAAATTDLASGSFTDAFSFWAQGNPAADILPADPGDVMRMATAPGPDGTVFSVMSTAEDGQYGCRTALLESKESAAQPQPTSFVAVTGNWCASEPFTSAFGGAGVDFVNDTAGYTVVAGDAVRAEVRADDGTEYPALLVNGYFWGWFPTSDHPTLTGYASDGSLVGEVALNLSE